LPTLINNCVFLDSVPNWASAPSSARSWKTNVAGVVTGAEQRQGLRAAAFRSQSCRITASTQPRRVLIEEQITAALASGRACMLRIGYRSLVLSATTTRVDIADTVLMAVGDWLVIRSGVILTAREIATVATPSAGVRRYGFTALAVAPSANDLVWPMLFGTLALKKVDTIDPIRAHWDIEISEPLGTGELGDSSACTPAALASTGLGLNLCGGALSLAADLDLECGLVKATLSWEEIFGADQYRIKRSPGSGGPYSTVTTVTGNVFSYDVARSMTAYYYVVTSISGGVESDPSAEILVGATTIEGVMRALRERADFVGETLPDWPDRISDSAATADYPADGWYTDAGVAARAVTYIQAIADAFDDTWLENYVTTATPTGVTAVADIPVHTTATLDVPTSASINTGNYAAKLFDLAASTCQLEHTLATTTVVDDDTRLGQAVGFKYNTGTGDGTLDTASPAGAFDSASAAAWQADTWGGGGQLIDLPNNAGATPGAMSGGPGAADGNPFLVSGAQAGTYDTDLESWIFTRYSGRGKLQADLSADARGSARLWLVLSQVGSGLPLPVAESGSLQIWEALTPGSATATSGWLANEMPPIPALNLVTINTTPPHTTLDQNEANWGVTESVVIWTRSHEPTAADWDHYP
jgi:hypothetical protein